MFIVCFTIKFILFTLQFKNVKSKHQLTTNQTNFNDDFYSIIPRTFYDKNNDYELVTMHNLIFQAVKFNDEICEFTFQVFLSFNIDAKSKF